MKYEDLMKLALERGFYFPSCEIYADAQAGFWEYGPAGVSLKNKFLEAVSDDFNVPQGLALIPELLKSDLKNEDKLATLLEFDKVFGLEFKAVLSQPQEPIPDPIKKLVQTREEMRKKKNWAEADKLRVQIEQLGYTVEDTIYGPDVKKI